MYAGLERFSVSAPGKVVNEYRIHGGKLELRTRDPRIKSARRGYWRRLETSEIMLHLLLDTVVGQWLLGRRGFHTALGAQGFGAFKRLHKGAA
jgi:hypothetical protein